MGARTTRMLRLVSWYACMCVCVCVYVSDISYATCVSLYNSVISGYIIDVVYLFVGRFEIHVNPRWWFKI